MNEWMKQGTNEQTNIQLNIIEITVTGPTADYRYVDVWRVNEMRNDAQIIAK